MNNTSNNKHIVGSQEWCSLPGLGIPAVKARVDSGAKTSSLHAFNIQQIEKDGEPWVQYEVHPIQKNRRITVKCESRLVSRRVIKSSNGESERRYVVTTSFLLNGEEWDIELTLTNRDAMGFRMLLGREAMSGRLLVDPDEIFVMGDRDPSHVRDLYSNFERKGTGLRIGVLASNPDLYSNRRLIEVGEERGHVMEFLSIKHCYMKLDAKKPEMHYRGGRVLHDLDAIIPRIRPSMTFYGCALLRQFASLGIYCQNNAEAITTSRDKLRSLQSLLDHQVDIPTTGFANSPLDTGDLISMVGGAPLIVKLLEGAQGMGVVLAETKKAAESVINAFKSLQANILVQEFIKEADGKDIRCFVVGNRVVGSIQRTAAPGEFRANIHQGGTAAPIKVTAGERRLAVKAAKAMGLKVAGVDIIRSQKGPLLLEVNSSPGLEGIEHATGEDIAGEMLGAIEKQLKWSWDKK